MRIHHVYAPPGPLYPPTDRHESARDRLMFEYTGRDDPMRATKDNLSADALDRRIRVLIKIPRELHVHVCNKDIHTNGSGTALEALEENELGTLLRVPSSNNVDPEAASEAEAPEASRLLRGRSPHLPALVQSVPAVLSTAATRKLEAEKKRLSLINTRTEDSLLPSTSSNPPASSTSKPDPKEIINIDDLPEDPAHHGDSAKGTSSPTPPPDQPSSRSPLKRNKSKRLSSSKYWITEIEGLRQNAENSQKAIQLLETRLQEETAKHAKFDELSARIQVLEAENESLKEFVKTSASQEHRARKELREKHARDLAELNEKLEKSQGRTVTMISKNKALEAEAEAIDKLIFPSLGFEWTKDSNLSRTEAYDEARISIDKLFEACRNRHALSEEAKTTVIDTMTKLMDRCRISSRTGRVQHAESLSSLGHCKAHFPLNLARCTRSPQGSDMGALKPKDTNSSLSASGSLVRYNKHDLPKDFPTRRKRGFYEKDPGQATSIPGRLWRRLPGRIW
ncbi:hypothetical protein QYE76_017728 [Lolium multiflorum]|uniref:Uncharacterized protein n=1 Tax=Lolium multiflorum TaxID=4521 RepID=A0AAD8QE11_LOLMU|nr:hypothetical protein QYE76_017728 [Lolium multiflorum]